jgi:hypothetical protein
LDSLDVCARNCLEDNQCFAATWDPDFKTGNTDYNCWKFMRDYQKSTNEMGFTTVRCPKEPEEGKLLQFTPSKCSFQMKSEISSFFEFLFLTF